MKTLKIEGLEMKKETSTAGEEVHLPFLAATV
jgi:hypothetical protein